MPPVVMLEQIPGTRQVTVGGDKAYDTAEFRGRVPKPKVRLTRHAEEEARTDRSLDRR